VLWVLYSAVIGFPARLETVFQTLAAATTLAMAFVIQHTQARAQETTHRKLDEVLRASPEADNSLITLEEAPDIELKDTEPDTRQPGCRGVDGGGESSGGGSVFTREAR
jgi:low affinity Fe/Cu permease